MQQNHEAMQTSSRTTVGGEIFAYLMLNAKASHLFFGASSKLLKFKSLNSVVEVVIMMKKHCVRFM